MSSFRAKSTAGALLAAGALIAGSAQAAGPAVPTLPRADAQRLVAYSIADGLGERPHAVVRACHSLRRTRVLCRAHWRIGARRYSGAVRLWYTWSSSAPRWYYAVNARLSPAGCTKRSCQLAVHVIGAGGYAPADLSFIK